MELRIKELATMNKPKKVEEIIYSYEKKTLTIIFNDGSMQGFYGDIAILKAKKLGLQEEII